MAAMCVVERKQNRSLIDSAKRLDHMQYHLKAIPTLSSSTPLLPVASRNSTSTSSIAASGAHTAQPSHGLGGAHQAKALVDTISRDNGPEDPGPVAEKGDENGSRPGDPDNVEHVLGQARGGEVLTRGLERLGRGIIAGPARFLERVLAEKAGDGEDEPKQKGARPEEEVREQEDAVDGEGTNVEVLEGRLVGLGPIFARFLSHCSG